MRSSSLELDLTKSQTQEGRNSVSLVDIAGFRTSIQQEGINAAAEHTFNRLTLRVQAAVTDYHYGDLGIFDPVLDTIIPQQDIRDYREDELRLRAF